VDHHIAQQLREGLVEPALGHDVAVELLTQRIAVVHRASGELRVEAAERLSHEARLLFLDTVQQDRVALSELASLELVAA
jgi:hypothetical protein